jgi:adenosylmethionine-8-amino-7-oxononanoate aminotransferase
VNRSGCLIRTDREKALGCVPAVRGYFQAVRATCNKYGALLILDEVMCGMGRTGTMHAWQSPLINVTPDIQTIGKGLGGGYAPVAGVLISRKVTDTLFAGTGGFAHGQTYQGHPVSCRAALEVLRVIQEENVAAMGEKLERSLKQIVLPLPHVGDVRGKGLFWGVSILEDQYQVSTDRNRSSLSRTKQQRSHSIQRRMLQWTFMKKVCAGDCLSWLNEDMLTDCLQG